MKQTNKHKIKNDFDHDRDYSRDHFYRFRMFLMVRNFPHGTFRSNYQEGYIRIYLLYFPELLCSRSKSLVGPSRKQYPVAFGNV